MELIEAIIKILNNLADIISTGGPKTVIFIILLNFAVGLFVVRQLARIIMTHYQQQLLNKDSEIKRLNVEIVKKDELLDERFEMFKELTHSYMSMSKEFSGSIKTIEMGLMEMRVRNEGVGRIGRSPKDSDN